VPHGGSRGSCTVDWRRGEPAKPGAAGPPSIARAGAAIERASILIWQRLIGDPRTRDPQRVLDDVRDGLITAEEVRRDYGVVINAQGWLDPVETERLRPRY